MVAVPFPHTIYTSQVRCLSSSVILLLPDDALCSNSGLESNDYWFGVRTTIGLYLE